MSEEKILEKFGVTAEQLDNWAAEYESNDWSNMEFGEVVRGRPKVFSEPLETITIKVPRSRVIAMRHVKDQKGISRSDFVRQAIDHELLEIM
jgi:transposase